SAPYGWTGGRARCAVFSWPADPGGGPLVGKKWPPPGRGGPPRGGGAAFTRGPRGHSGRNAPLAARTWAPAGSRGGVERGDGGREDCGGGRKEKGADRAGVRLLLTDQQAFLGKEMGSALLMMAGVEWAGKPAGDIDAAEPALK